MVNTEQYGIDMFTPHIINASFYNDAKNCSTVTDKYQILPGARSSIPKKHQTCFVVFLKIILSNLYRPVNINIKFTLKDKYTCYNNAIL